MDWPTWIGTWGVGGGGGGGGDMELDIKGKIKIIMEILSKPNGATAQDTVPVTKLERRTSVISFFSSSIFKLRDVKMLTSWSRSLL